MLIGNSSAWLKAIIDIDKKVIECVVRVWPSVISRLSQREKEDNITQRLVDCLREDRVIYEFGFIDIHFKLREQDCIGDYSTKGILDMALFLEQDYETYIAYECKRLNIVSDKGKRTASLAGAYVEEGVVRYVTAKYSEKLPYGCMLGYVMDGDAAFAFQQLNAAIVKRKKLISLKNESISLLHREFPEFETTHARQSDKAIFTVRHRLLSMRPGGQALAVYSQ